LAVSDLDHDRIDEDRRVDFFEWLATQVCISSMTLSVIRLIVSFDTDAP